MRDDNWSDRGMRCFGMVIDGRAQPTGIRRRGDAATLLLVFNAHHDLVEFTLPEYPGGSAWTRLIDTNLDDDPAAELPSGEVYGVTARSFLLFALKADGS
jgi:glycogen operon protein